MAVDRRPTALALKSWIFIGSVPYAVGFLRLPVSLRDGPGVFGYAAVWALTIGAALSLLGLLWRGESLNGIVIEQVGLVGIVVGLVLYFIGLATALPLTRDRLGDIGIAGGLCAAVCAGAIWQYATHRRYRLEQLKPRGDDSGDVPDHGHHHHG